VILPPTSTSQAPVVIQATKTVIVALNVQSDTQVSGGPAAGGSNDANKSSNSDGDKSDKSDVKTKDDIKVTKNEPPAKKMYCN
jgi:hypothetical protein